MFTLCYISINSVAFISFFSDSFLQRSYLTNVLAAESVDWKSSTSYVHELFRELGALNYYYMFLNIRISQRASLSNKSISYARELYVPDFGVDKYYCKSYYSQGTCVYDVPTSYAPFLSLHGYGSISLIADTIYL